MTATIWTNEPLPDGVLRVAIAPSCRTCNATTLTASGSQWTMPCTRTAEPDPDHDNLYVVQPHELWCPMFTGERAELACPDCGAPIQSYDFASGFTLTVREPLGERTLVGTWDEISGHPMAGFAAAMSSPQRDPDFDQLTLEPCGHVLKGGHAHQVVKKAAEIRLAQRQREADATIAAAEPVLRAAEAGGHPVLAEAYRTAVRHSTSDVSGLLKALTVLYPGALPGDPT